MKKDEAPKPSVPFVPIPAAHLRAARIFKALFVRVPHDEGDLEHPDPDYGL